MPRHITLVFACAAWLAPSALAADGDSPHRIDILRPDVHVSFGGYGSLGAGLRVDIPILRRGFIEGVDDELALSPGADVFFYSAFYDYYAGGPYVIPSIVLQWNFYIGQWSLFPEAGVALYVGDRRYLRHGDGFYVRPDFGLGARYHFSPRNALLARVSTPTGFQLGVTF